MAKKYKYILAIIIGVLPLYTWMIWYRLTHAPVFTTNELLLYPILIGGGNIIWILLLNKHLLKDKLSSFNPGSGKWPMDILVGLLLTGIYFSLMFIERETIMKWLPSGPPPSNELINMMIGLANNPILLAIWLGPVVWIGIALFEEVSRTFLLNCLWKVSPGRNWDFVVILIVAVIIGVAHLYQGMFGIVSIGFKSIIMGLYYYRYRRILPLIISHGLYDSFQVIFFVSQVG